MNSITIGFCLTGILNGFDRPPLPPRSALIMRLPGHHHGNLRQKILLAVGLPITALLVLVVAVLGASLYRNLHAAGLSRIATETRSAATRIDNWNLETVTVPRIMAAAQENGLFGQRQASLAYARRILESYPQFTGAYFGYEPNADGKDAAFRQQATGESARAIDTQGRFIPYWFRDRKDADQIRLSPLVDLESSFYYRGLKNRMAGAPEMDGVSLAGGVSRHYDPAASTLAAMGKAMVTEPYLYEGKMIVEQTWPIVIDGRFAGVAGVDRSLDAIDRFMRELKPYRTADFILISHRGRIISATLDDQLKTRPIEQTPFAGTLETLWKSTRNDVEVAMHTETHADGGDLIYAAVRVPTGDWLVVMRVTEAEILEPVWVGLRRVLLLGGLGLGLTLALLAWLAGSVARPVGAAARAASRVAGGDLTVCVETGGADETGQLLDAIRRMTLSLGGLVGKVRHSGQAVNAAASRIEDATRAQETVVSDLGSSTTQISAAATEISTTARELLKTMNDVTGLAADTANLARAGQAGIQGMASVMRGVEFGAKAIAARLSVIDEGARAVTGVVATMTQVADQTNLLSLNAAIEAVKAREHGAGFGVVAEEIRRLADQTAVAALDIEQRVLEMKASVVEGVDEMRQFGAQVHEAVDAVVRLSGQLNDIIGRVQDLLPRFEQVNQGMRSQSVGAEEISMSMRILSGVAHQTTDSITELNATVAELRQAVTALSEEIAFFRVREQTPTESA